MNENNEPLISEPQEAEESILKADALRTLKDFVGIGKWLWFFIPQVLLPVLIFYACLGGWIIGTCVLFHNNHYVWGSASALALLVALRFMHNVLYPRGFFGDRI